MSKGAGVIYLIIKMKENGIVPFSFLVLWYSIYVIEAVGQR